MSANPIAGLRRSLSTTAYTSGSTHNFYHYPARFHPEVAREVITSFSRKGSWILDPFMGGGTSVVEALALGRLVAGTDINSLAKFVADVRTHPLSSADKDEIRRWARSVSRRLVDSNVAWVPRTDIVNLPGEAELFISGALELSKKLLPRRRNFARTVLLRLGQLTLDCRNFDVPHPNQLANKLALLVEEMISGLDELVESCRRVGVAKNSITGRRLLLHRSAVGLAGDRRIRQIIRRPRLVFTSPPYPGVHVLYHRWQYRGRRETPAPYWIANVTDGSGLSYYCGGSRSPTGLRNYFQMIEGAFDSVSRILHPDGRVVQIVGFNDVQSQLPAYLRAMERAGFREVRYSKLGGKRLKRRVANRKWYTKINGDGDASTEYLLVHRPTS